ncbi:MAG: hypothetical protein JNM59_09735 [Hyphomonadaceae bacterium]|nr:hypothetical protein [Hyphomonadaceae bacterium]
MRVLPFVAASFAVGCQQTLPPIEANVAAAPVACQHTAGLIDGPYVADEATARRIALAVILGMERREELISRERQRRYDLKVEDRGAYWIAFQTVRGYPRREGDAIIVMAGGGGLEMRIAKCDGTISEVHWSR